MTVAITINLEVKTCGCGSVYGIPSWVTWHECPMCGEKKRRELKDELSTAYAEQDRLAHIISGLRGALKRRLK